MITFYFLPDVSSIFLLACSFFSHVMILLNFNLTLFTNTLDTDICRSTWGSLLQCELQCKLNFELCCIWEKNQNVKSPVTLITGVFVSREAARECRRKKKEYVRCLENRVAVLENQNKTLIEQLRALKDIYRHKVQ